MMSIGILKVELFIVIKDFWFTVPLYSACLLFMANVIFFDLISIFLIISSFIFKKAIPSSSKYENILDLHSAISSIESKLPIWELDIFVIKL